MLIIKADVGGLVRGLTQAQREQVPLATALAVNKIAKRVIKVETDALTETFKKPRAFTLNAFTQSQGFGGMFATKKLPIAIIVAKPIQAGYLAPSEGPKDPQKLWQGAQNIRTPVDIKTNASGDIPRSGIAKALASPDTFFAEMGGLLGIWQIPTAPRVKGAPRRPKGSIKQHTGRNIKLLVAFTRPKSVKTDLKYAARAQATVDAFWAEDFGAAIDEAMKMAAK